MNQIWPQLEKCPHKLELSVTGDNTYNEIHIVVVTCFVGIMKPAIGMSALGFGGNSIVKETGVTF